MRNQKQRSGFVLVICMFLLVIMAAWSFLLCKMASWNLQIANNHVQSNKAFAAASSGLDITKYWMINDVNDFTGIYHVLSTAKQQGFIVDVDETNSNSLTVTITGFAGDFTKQVGGDFVYHENPGWQFLSETYWER